MKQFRYFVINATMVFAIVASPLSEAVFHLQLAADALKKASEDEVTAKADLDYDALLRELKKLEVLLKKDAERDRR